MARAMTPSSAISRWYSVHAPPRFFASMCWQWSAWLALHSRWSAFIVDMAPANDVRLNPPLDDALALQPITAACRVSGVR